MAIKNQNLADLANQLAETISEKDAEITQLQAKLSGMVNSLQAVTMQFNDSLIEIKKERAQISSVNNQMNTVYYITGTLTELHNKGIVTKEGGFIGMGRVAVVNSTGMDNSKFTKADLTTLKGINLHGKFRRLITTHPDNSYTLISKGKTDSLAITNATAFWSESKYLVIATR